MNKLKLKVGAKVMLIKNIRTEDGLTNGQTGKLAHVVRDSKGGVKYLMVRFNRENVFFLYLLFLYLWRMLAR